MSKKIAKPHKMTNAERMQQAANEIRPLLGLSDRQRTALDMIVAGRTDGELPMPWRCPEKSPTA